MKLHIVYLDIARRPIGQFIRKRKVKGNEKKVPQWFLLRLTRLGSRYKGTRVVIVLALRHELFDSETKMAAYHHEEGIEEEEEKRKNGGG